ncbi:hypothetical protein [Streptomyces sp. SD15]
MSYGNGFHRWNFPDFAGDGNGFKLGGGSPAPAVADTVRNADVAGSQAGLTANLSVADGRAAALGSTTTSRANSWHGGGTWDESSVLSTDPAALTGARDPDGSLPSAPTFLVPRDGTSIGARF